MQSNKNYQCLETDLEEVQRREEKFNQFWLKKEHSMFVKKLEENYKIVDKLDVEGNWVHLKSFHDMQTYLAIRR